MHISRMMALPLLGAALLLPACRRGDGNPSVAATAEPGPSVDVYAYSADRDGDWHTNYKNWAPTTVYESNGTYYPNNVNGSRQVQVYHSPSGYVMPPRDKDVGTTDKRLNTKNMPSDADYSRAKARP